MRAGTGAVAVAVLSLRICPGCLAAGGGVPSALAGLPTDFVQMMPAGDPQNESWIVWDQPAGAGMAVHLSLCDRAGRCRWSRTWPGAYEPTIRLMGPWSNDSLSLFLVTYQEGAAAETAVVVGLSPGGAPVIYDQRDGAWVNVAPDNATVLIDQDPGTHVDLDCLRWNAAARHLGKVHCHPGLVGGQGDLP